MLKREISGFLRIGFHELSHWLNNSVCDTAASGVSNASHGNKGHQSQRSGLCPASGFEIRPFIEQTFNLTARKIGVESVIHNKWQSDAARSRFIKCLKVCLNLRVQYSGGFVMGVGVSGTLPRKMRFVGRSRSAVCCGTNSQILSE